MGGAELQIVILVGAPVGGAELLSNSDSGRSFILSKFGMSSIPHTSLFGNMLRDRKDLNDDIMFCCFMSVALSCLLSILFVMSKLRHTSKSKNMSTL